MVNMVLTVEAGPQFEKMRKAHPAVFLKAGKKIEFILMRGVGIIFAEEGPGWAPLKPATIKKRRGGKSAGVGAMIRILRDTGDLSQSITDRGNRNHVGIVTPELVEVGTTKVQARAQNFGYAPRNLPPRPFMRIRPVDRKLITKIVKDAVLEAAGAR